MASSSMCLRCLRKSLRSIKISSLQPHTSKTLFSSTSAKAATPQKKKPNTAAAAYRMKQVSGRGKKKGQTSVSTGKPPATGERKAVRKRVVLSNTSAVPVRSIQNIDKGTVDSFRTIEGHMAGLTDATVDALRALEAFKSSQGWKVYSQPATIIRTETARLFELMKLAERDTSPAERTWRIILDGDRASGKSVLQLQALAAAHTKGWVIMHIPEAKELVEANTAFRPATGDDGKIMYIQPQLAADLLAKIHKANATLLSDMQLAHTHKFDIPIQSNISLARLVELGTTDLDLAYPVWQAFLKEITTASQEGKGLQRPPVLLSIDNVAHMMRFSGYVDPKMKPIHAQELAIVADLSRVLGGNIALGNGGIVLAATSCSNRPATPLFDHLIAEKIAASRGLAPPRWNPFAARDSRVESAVQGTEIMRVGGISKKETKSLMEYYAMSGLMRRFVANHLVGEKWAVSGGGIIGALERACVMQRI